MVDRKALADDPWDVERKGAVFATRAELIDLQ